VLKAMRDRSDRKLRNQPHEVSGDAEVGRPLSDRFLLAQE
jgi:hypothetical protein